MKQKILVLCYNYEASQFPKSPDPANRFFTYGFGGMFGKLLRKYLGDYDIEVWRVDSYCEEKYYEKKIDGVVFKVFCSYSIPKLGHFSWQFIKDLKKEQKLNEPVLFIVHTHNWQTYNILFFLRNAKIITTHHGELSPFYIYGSVRGFRKMKAYLGILAEKLVMKNVDYFLIGDTRQVEYIKKAVEDFKFSLFSSGLDFETLKPLSRPAAREILGWDNNKYYILYVGKLYKYKQVEELIRIWVDIKKELPNTELVLVGNEPRGSWGEEYYDLAVQYGAIIVGRVLHSELYKYYCAANVYVLVALRDDYFGGTGIAPIESLALNTPVVSYSMRNYFGNKDERFIEMPSDIEGYKKSIIKIMKNRDDKLTTRNIIKKYYSHEAVVKIIENALDEVLKKN
ncbi:MAG: glycosyltransferase [Ignavibacteria bacterium]|nr:glycosyltransferase [Ignavibacteria bacterium]